VNSFLQPRVTVQMGESVYQKNPFEMVSPRNGLAFHGARRSSSQQSLQEIQEVAEDYGVNERQLPKL
jgi:hypothetical protein